MADIKINKHWQMKCFHSKKVPQNKPPLFFSLSCELLQYSYSVTMKRYLFPNIDYQKSRFQ